MVRDKTIGGRGVEGQSRKQQMCFPLGKARVCPLDRFQTCFQSASTSVILGLSFPIWNGRASQRVEPGMMLSVGRYSGRNILSTGRVAVGTRVVSRGKTWTGRQQAGAQGDSDGG